MKAKASPRNQKECAHFEINYTEGAGKPESKTENPAVQCGACGFTWTAQQFREFVARNRGKRRDKWR